ncbi:MAG: hypothetical protein R3F62_25605 [Planctomycetota bacterium]
MLTRRTHGRWGAWLLLALGPVLGQEPAPLAELEPNDTAEIASQTLALGQPFQGTLGTPGALGDDEDWLWIELTEATRVDLRYAPEGGARAAGILELAAPGFARWDLPLARGEARYLGLTLPAGRYPLRLQARRVAGLSYTLTLDPAPEAPDAELEPNDPPQAPATLELGAPRRGWVSHTYFDKDRYRVEIPERGVYRLEVELPDLELPDGQPQPPSAHWTVSLGAAGEKPTFAYRLDDVDGARSGDGAPRRFRFYPVLEPGAHDLLLGATRGEVGAAYSLEVTRLDSPTPDADLLEAGRQAIDHGLRYLLELEPSADRTSHDLAAEACQLLALAEGSGAPELSAGRAQKVQAILESVGARLKEVPDLPWAGTPVKRFGNYGLYEQAMITLALAECALAGREEARPLCAEGVRFLLAAQISPDRPPAYSPSTEDDPECGGWRYVPSARSGDLSVSGWCLIALFAADVAGVEVPGLQRGVVRALRFVKACSRADGFAYDTRSKPNSLIQQGIGALLGLLFDEPSGSLDRALVQLDLHQCAGTQSGWGHDSPFYSWYYATRVHFLRGGAAWRTWRTLTLRQLVGRQNSDGSWSSIRDEGPVGTRYASGLAIVILRLCLGEAPGYLNQELEAF